MTSRAKSPMPKAKAENAEATSSGEVKSAQGTSEEPKFTPPARPAGLRESLLKMYGVLAVSLVVFALIGESLKHDIPEGKYEKRDGSLINIGDFDPVELGPYPKCHPHHGEHEVVAEDGTRQWVKNSDAPKGGPFPVGHPDNPDWITKIDAIGKKINAETRFQWQGIHPQLHLLTLATLCVIIGCKHGVWVFTEPPETRKAAQVLESGDAYWFPVMGSGVLLGLFLVLKYLGTDLIKTLITCFVVLTCTVGVGTNSDAIVALIKNKSAKTLFHIPYFDENVTAMQLIGCLVGSAMAYGYVISKNWIVNNIFGVSFCLLGIRSIDIASYKTGAILLIGLFFYDVFWVFGSKSVFGSNVMVSVATGVEAPIKLMFPRGFGGCGMLQHGMLGLGDIAVPGLFISFMAKWDAVKIGDGSSNSFVYLNWIMVAYVLSLITTVAIMLIFNHAQPALLYIVPYILIASVAVALARGEFKELVAYSIPGEEEEEEKKPADDKKEEEEKKSK